MNMPRQDDIIGERPGNDPAWRQETPLPTLFVGDLHGNLPFLTALEAQYPNHMKIFVGDFVDARTNFSRDDELACLDLVLTMIEAGRARACIGNHEWSYLEPSMRCTLYSHEFDLQLAATKSRMRQHLEFFIWFPSRRILTHAGLSNQLWQECGFTMEKLPGILTEWSLLPIADTPAGWIGLSRGGLDPTGGIFWCDYYLEFSAVPNLVQVFGHTSGLSGGSGNEDPQRGIRNSGSNYNVDCLSRTWEVLELTSEGMLRPVKIERSR